MPVSMEALIAVGVVVALCAALAWAVWMDRKAKVPFFWPERKDDE